MRRNRGLLSRMRRQRGFTQRSICSALPTSSEGIRWLIIELHRERNDPWFVSLPISCPLLFAREDNCQKFYCVTKAPEGFGKALDIGGDSSGPYHRHLPIGGYEQNLAHPQSPR